MKCIVNTPLIVPPTLPYWCIAVVLFRVGMMILRIISSVATGFGKSDRMGGRRW